MTENIHYHGTPIWGNKGEVLSVSVRGGAAFVSFARPDQIKQCLEQAESLGLDNGAFSAWKRGLVIDWQKQFYPWLMLYYHHPKIKFFIIPDVIEGGEEDNDRLIAEVPGMFKEKAVPVWHLHESIGRLVRLCNEWPRVAFGSSGQYAVIRTKIWHDRMREAFEAIKGINVKIHGLRMLDGRVLGTYPLDTADSTNLACNVPKYLIKYPDIGSNLIKNWYIEHGYIQSPDWTKATWAIKNEPRLSYINEPLIELKKDKVFLSGLLIHRAAVLRGAVESVKPPMRTEYYERLQNHNVELR